MRIHDSSIHKSEGSTKSDFGFSIYKLRSGSKLVGAPLYMGFLYGVKIARLDDYMGFLYGAPPDLTVHFWAQKTQNNVSQKAQMLLQKIVTDSLPPPRFTASTTTLVSLPGRKPVLTTLARVPDPVVRVWTARKICVANPVLFCLGRVVRRAASISVLFPSPSSSMTMSSATALSAHPEG